MNALIKTCLLRFLRNLPRQLRAQNLNIRKISDINFYKRNKNTFSGNTLRGDNNKRSIAKPCFSVFGFARLKNET